MPIPQATVSRPDPPPAGPRKARRPVPRFAWPARLRWPTIGVSRRIGVLLVVMVWAYAAATLLAALFLWVLGDRWWLATVFLFGPRWPLLLPAVPLAAVCLFVRPRLLAVLAVATLIVVGPTMGFNLGWRRWLAGSATRELRLVTFNVDGAENPRLTAAPAALLRLNPDVVVMQECDYHLADPTLWPARWTIQINGDVCLFTRLGLIDMRTEDRVSTGEQGGTGTVAFYRLLAPGDTIEIANVHLETPRKGLEPLRFNGDVGSLSLNTLVRDVGSARSRRWIAAQSVAPLIAGDFNLPPESRIFRAHWSDCPDAFRVAGNGFGYTRVLKRFSARIDHVLTCGPWRALHAEIGPDLGSDHRPLIVDLGRHR